MKTGPKVSQKQARKQSRLSPPPLFEKNEVEYRVNEQVVTEEEFGLFHGDTEVYTDGSAIYGQLDEVAVAVPPLVDVVEAPSQAAARLSSAPVPSAPSQAASQVPHHPRQGAAAPLGSAPAPAPAPSPVPHFQVAAPLADLSDSMALARTAALLPASMAVVTSI